MATAIVAAVAVMLVLTVCFVPQRSSPEGPNETVHTSPSEPGPCEGIQEACADYWIAWRNVIANYLHPPWEPPFPTRSRDSDGTLRTTIVDSPETASPSSLAGSFRSSFEVERWEELPAEDNQIRFRGPCGLYPHEPSRVYLECEAIISFREEGDTTYISATFLGRFIDEIPE